MSETPSPYNHLGPETPDLQRLARFMDNFLSIETLDDIPCPEHLKCDYDDLDEDNKKEWYEFTFHELFRIAAMESFGFLRREPNVVELGLIKRRIVNFFKTLGIEYERT